MHPEFPESDADWLQDLAEMESAEDFLAYFDIAYDPSVVQVNRLHILKRFHQLLEAARARNELLTRERYAELLERAYQDFVAHSALELRVMQVHRRAAGIATLPLQSIRFKKGAGHGV